MSSVEYAYARIAARHGSRPSAADWHRIETARTLAGLLDAARGGAFDRWLAGLDATSTTHEIEAFVRMRWRAHVDEVARWMPDVWKPAIQWCKTLTDVPVLAHLARGGAPLPWFDADPVYRQFNVRSPNDRLLASLAPAPGQPEALGDAWYDEWRRRVPRGDSGPLAELERLLLSHLSAFRASDPGDGTPLRSMLEARLDVLFRRAIGTPAAVLVFIALTLVDLERLRGELLRRAAFPRQRLAA